MTHFPRDEPRRNLARKAAALILDLHEKTLRAAEGGSDMAEEWVRLRADYVSACSTTAAIIAAAFQDIDAWNTRAPAAPTEAMVERIIERVTRDVAELPDRTSPEDAPLMMLVTGEELEAIIRAALTAAAGDGETK